MRSKSENNIRERTMAAIPACLSGWIIPGLGHFIIGCRTRAIMFFGVVMMLFAVGLYLDGELFAVGSGDILSKLAGLAEIGVGLPYFVVDMLELGKGNVTSVTYEYGYTFLIVAGLMNMLIVLDVFDIAVGRKN